MERGEVINNINLYQMENSKKEQQEEAKRLSYSELENVCHQLSAQAQQLNAQNQQLRVALNDANLTNLYKRLDYLFEVINKDNPYLSVDFKKQCANEIETLMATPEQPEDTPKTDKED